MIHNLKKAAAINTNSVEYYGSMSAHGYLHFSAWRKNGFGKGDVFSTKFKKGNLLLQINLTKTQIINL